MKLLLPSLCAAVLSGAICYPLARWSLRLRLVAQPRPDRWNKAVIPNTGGIAVLLAAALCFLVFVPSAYAAIVVSSAAIGVFGFFDDRFEFPPLTKLLGQIVAAAVVVAAGAMFPLTPWVACNAALSIVWLVAVTNAFNLIDNMDGLCAGVALIVAFSGALLAVLHGHPQKALMMAILGGAAAGFLAHNYKPARIFLGDCGSMFLGFSLAALAIDPQPGDSRLPNVLYAIPAFFYPVFDAVLVSVLRTRARKPIWTGGRDHSSHRLVATGLTERSAVWILWAVAAICATCGPLTYHLAQWFVPALIVLIITLTGFAVFLSSVPVSPSAPPAISPLVAWPAPPTQTVPASGTKDECSIAARS